MMRCKLPAPAKVNLYLLVRARRADGLHELDTAFAYVDCFDWIAFSPAPTLKVECSQASLSGEANLVHRALRSLRAASPHPPSTGLHIFIDKNIPVQAGFGGGSSDAACALLFANRYWRIGLRLGQLMHLGLSLGADLPAFLFGRASIAGGVGERLRPWPHPLPGPFVVLATPHEGLSTARVFQRYDQLQLTSPNKGDTIRPQSGSGEQAPCPRVGMNDLEEAACSLYPPLASLLGTMRRHARQAWMSGSGTGCIAVVESMHQADRLGRLLRREGLASWIHCGRLLSNHPMAPTPYAPEEWGVAKR